MEILAFARQVYAKIETPTIPLRITEKSLHRHIKLIRYIRMDDIQTDNPQTDDRQTKYSARTQAFACLAIFESGGRRIDPYGLESVMALSSRHSIFVADTILSDPADLTEESNVRRITGNVGQPGITLMISPEDLRVKAPSQSFRAAVHAEYDYKRIDKFSGTSLHLTFTKWKLPLSDDHNHHGLVDQDVFIAEAVVSVRDSGQ